MITISSAFHPLIGELVWNVRKGYGTAILCEFGQPYRQVEEPRQETAASSDLPRQDHRRRRVFIHGEWSLLILHAAWTARSGDLLASSTASDTATITKVLAQIDGQALTDVSPTAAGRGLRLSFDLGGSITTQPSDEVADQWSLHARDGVVTHQSFDGQLHIGREIDT